MPLNGDFESLWRNYPKGFGHDHSLTDREDHDRIAQLNDRLKEKIGGEVNNSTFVNLCAVRMSYALNRSGLSIPKNTQLKYYGKNKDGTPYIFGVAHGADGYCYGRGVIETFHYLSEKFGKPDTEIPGSFFEYIDHNPVPIIPSKLKSKKGILVFFVSKWNDAQGHITLWNGVECADNGYWVEADKVAFWEVKSPVAGSVRIHNPNDSIRIIAKPVP